MIQQRFVHCYRARGVGKRGKSRGLSRGNQLFGRPDVVRGGPCEKVSPVGGFCLHDALEVTKLGLSRDGVGVGGLKFFGPSSGFRKLFPKGGQERGPPSFGPWGGAGAGRGGFQRRRERGEGRGEPLVELIARGSSWGGRDLRGFEFVSKGRPVELLPGWFGLSLWGEGGARRSRSARGPIP